jgi:hypothetical protein
MAAVANVYKASDFHQTSINGPKFMQKKGNGSQHTLEVIELIRLEIVRIRFAALGGAWINRVKMQLTAFRQAFHPTLHRTR